MSWSRARFSKIKWQVSQEDAIMRIHFVMACFVMAFLLINIRLILVSTNSSDQAQRVIRANIYRKDIVDRNGHLVATSLPVYSLFANPAQIADKKSLVEKLSKILKVRSKTKMLNDLSSNKKFVWLKHDLTPKEEMLITNLGEPGIGLEKSFKRVYTQGNLMSHALGYVSRSNQGLAGVERFFDQELMVDELSAQAAKQNNQKLELTLDSRIQNIVNQELDRAIIQFRAQGGVAVVADPNTGEILSLISKPDFNPHNPGNCTPEQLFNKASLGSFEYGSIFKILTMAIALETKSTNLSRQYDITDLKIGKFNIQDFTHTTGVQTVSEIFAKSSNKGTGRIALEIGESQFRHYLRKLRLDDQVMTQISEKAPKSFKTSTSWSDISTVTISYGYGIATSVLSIVQAIIPTINGGTLLPLTLVKSDTGGGGEKIFSESTCQDMRKLMRLVVTCGSGRKSDVKGYLVGGKSGTANKLVGKSYVKNARRSSFIAAFPIDNPQYVIYVMLDNPQPTKETGGYTTGGATAAPVVGQIIARIASLKGMLPYNEDIDFDNISKKANGA